MKEIKETKKVDRQYGSFDLGGLLVLGSFAMRLLSLGGGKTEKTEEERLGGIGSIAEILLERKLAPRRDTPKGGEIDILASERERIWRELLSFQRDDEKKSTNKRKLERFGEGRS